jgi:YYY domain-containing protein
LIWWLTLEVLGVAAWPVAWTVMGRLPDRGWAFSKALGLLLVGYGAWLIGMFQLAPFSRASNIAMLLALIAGAAWMVLRNGRALWGEMRAFLRGQARYWVAAEVLFGLAFVAWTILRAYAPNIYGTEKFMDFAFLNSFTQGQVLPPNDPWLAGYAINYYYFGYTLMGTLCHLSGVDSAVGFNLANVTLFSLTVLGAFGVVYNLVAGTLRSRRPAPARRAEVRAVASPRATVTARSSAVALPTRRVPGRGAAIAEAEASPATGRTNGHANGNGAAHSGNGRNGAAHVPPEAPSAGTLRVPWQAIAAGVLAGLLVAVVGNLAAAGQVITEHQTADTFNWWNPSRVVNDGPTAPLNGETINEFPFFSFLLNDMHPHMLVLPLVLLVLGLALALLKAGALRPHDAASARARRRGLLGGGLDNGLRLFVYALALGSLYVANTWDYPTYLLIVLVALALPMLGTTAARWAFAEGEGDAASPASGLVGRLRAWRETRLGSWVTQAATLVALSLLLYLPFHLTFKSLVGGESIELPAQVASLPILGGLATKLSSLIGINIWPKTWQGFITIFGFFLYAIVALVGVMLVRGLRARRAAGEAPGNTPLFVLGGVVAVSLVGAVALQFPLMALLPPLAAVAIYLIRERLQPGRWSSEELFALGLIAVGAAITFGTEIFFLQDVFHSRFNTLFKFYYQVWILWGLAAAYATWWLLSRAFRRVAAPGHAGAPVAAQALAGAWGLGFAGLFGLAMIYPVLAPAARENGVVWLPFVQVANPAAHQMRGLDGIAWMGAGAPGDLAAIRWLRANAPGTAGIAEATFNYEYNTSGNHGRVSAYTGMPTIIAWPGHEYQWRGGQPDIRAQIDPRQAALNELYQTTDVARAQQIMQQYGIRYVFVGTIEKGEQGRAPGDTGPWRYSAQALSKFGTFMQTVFNQDDTTVYLLPAAPAGAAPNQANPGALPHP